eukprot:TRINITY_DN2489_c0_g2_i2.p1 TRINITY_DN2489_c0_g2~~TRINITY_DN2489_c0_g2_i2.p1  ORF type:complete len:1765 (+),score=590.72 TRINITY_DN2489_c0_g2_i2:579-5297(+)
MVTVLLRATRKRVSIMRSIDVIGKNHAFEWDISLEPLITIENLLPCDTEIRLQRVSNVKMDVSTLEMAAQTAKRSTILYDEIQTGHKVPIHFCGKCPKKNVPFSFGDELQVALRTKSSTVACDWSVSTSILAKSNQPDLYVALRVKPVDSEDELIDRTTIMYIRMASVERHKGSLARSLSIYADYWLVNHFGQDISVKTGNSNIHHNHWITSGTAEPNFKSVLFFSHDPKGNNKCALALGGSDFSNPFSLDIMGTAGVVETFKPGKISIGDHYGESAPVEKLEATIISKPAMGNYSRSKIVELWPRFRVVNSTGYTIICRQMNCEREIKISPNDSMPFHWSDSSVKSPNIQIRVDGTPDNAWSGQLDISNTGQTMLKVAKPIPEMEDSETVEEKDISLPHMTFGVDVGQVGVSVNIVFTPEEKTVPQILVDNRTNVPIEVCQENINIWTCIPAFSKIQFVWDEPTEKQRIIARVMGTNTGSTSDLRKADDMYARTYRLHAFKRLKSLLTPTESIPCELVCSGPTKVLQFGGEPTSNEEEEEDIDSLHENEKSNRINLNQVESAMATTRSQIDSLNRIMEQLSDGKTASPTAVEALDIPAAVLDVIVNRTTGLAPQFRTHDSLFATATFASTTFETSIVKKRADPIFNEHFEFNLDEIMKKQVIKMQGTPETPRKRKSASLVVQLRAKHKFRKITLGSVTISLEDLMDEGPSEEWYTLVDKNGADAGQIYLRVQYLHTDLGILSRFEDILYKRETTLHQRHERLEIENNEIKERIELKTKQLEENKSKDLSKRRVKTADMHVEIISASNLINVDTLSLSDPFTIVSIQDQKFQTKVIDDNLNPEWNTKFTIPVDCIGPNRQSNIHFKVMDEDFTENTTMGTASIPLLHFIQQGPQWSEAGWSTPDKEKHEICATFDGNLPLDYHGTDGGTLQVKITLEPTSFDDEISTMEVSMLLKGVGVSIIDQTAQELMFISMKGVGLSASDNFNELSGAFDLQDFQICVQTPQAAFPILLSRDRMAAEINGSKPFLSASVLMSHKDASVMITHEKNKAVRKANKTAPAGTETTNVLQFPYCSILMQPVEVNIDDGFLIDTLKFLLELPLDAFTDKCVGPLAAFGGVEPWSSVEGEAMKQSAMRLYFKLLQIHPIKILLTLQQRGLLFSDQGPLSEYLSHPLMKIVANIGGALGALLANLDRAPVKVNALIMENPFVTPEKLTDVLINHVIKNAIRELYRILGSLEFLGNPVGLVSGVGSGVKDFFYEPANALLVNPKQAHKALAKGTMSLLGHTTGGVFNAASKISESVGKGVAKLSMDDAYLAKRRAAANEKKSMKSGIKKLGRGIGSGLAGVVKNPIKGAKKGGVGGFMKGIASGAAGVVLKPTVGVLDAVSDTTAGLRDANLGRGTIGMLPRHRTARAFGPRNIMIPFNERRSQGLLLFTAASGKKFTSVGFGGHYMLGNQTAKLQYVLAFGGAHLVLLAVKCKPGKSSAKQNISIEWLCKWNEIDVDRGVTVCGKRIWLFTKSGRELIMELGTCRREPNIEHLMNDILQMAQQSHHLATLGLGSSTTTSESNEDEK